jgi:hypothetical protein
LLDPQRAFIEAILGGMKRTPRRMYAALTLMLIPLLLGAYVGAYLGLSEVLDPAAFKDDVGRVRCFANKWSAMPFTPLVWIESQVVEPTRFVYRPPAGTRTRVTADPPPAR